MQPQIATGNQTLAALAQQGMDRAQTELDAAAQKRKQRRMGLLGGMA